MSEILEIINVYLDPFSVVVGVVTAVPIFWTWWEVIFGRRRRHRKWFMEMRKSTGERPGILTVDLLPGRNIQAAVERHAGNDDSLRVIPDERRWVIQRSANLKETDMPELARELRERANDVLAAGVDTLHVFYAGPVVPPALVGAEFVNTCKVLLYQHDPARGYLCWGPLRHVVT